MSDSADKTIHVHSPAPESQRRGKSYSLKLEGPAGAFGFHWWPCSRTPEQAMAEMMDQLRLLPPELRQILAMKLSEMMAAKMHEAIVKEAWVQGPLILDGKPSETKPRSEP